MHVYIHIYREKERETSGLGTRAIGAHVPWYNLRGPTARDVHK
jgi:hypothetical protein